MMDHTTCEMLCEVLSICYKISQTKADCFFEYMPMINCYTVQIYYDGFNAFQFSEHTYVGDVGGMKITTENLNLSLTLLKEIAKELGVEL